MENKDIYIRVDSGNVVGDGHLFRSKAIAAHFQTLGYKITYVTRPHKGYNPSKFVPYDCVVLSKPLAELKSDTHYSQWLVATEDSDATECLDAVQPAPGSLWIVDHYAIGSEWEKKIQDSQQFVVAIDDLSRTHNANVLIDHNLTASVDKYTDVSTTPNTVYAIGTQYALLRNEIIKAPKYKASMATEDTLLYLGTCTKEIFLKVLQALRLNLKGSLTILNPPPELALLENEKLAPFTSDIPSLYQQYRLIIGSCGVANLERMCLGVPTITAAVVENQKEVGTYLEKHFPQMYLGYIQDISQVELNKNLGRLLELPKTEIQEHIKKQQAAVSDQGIAKVAELILKTLHQKF